MKTKKLIKELKKLPNKDVYLMGDNIDYGFSIDAAIELSDKIILVSQVSLEKFIKEYKGKEVDKLNNK